MIDISIRELLYSDVEQIRFLQPKGWGDISFFFRLYTSHTFCFPIAAIHNDKIVGVATGIKNNSTGWVAHIIVSPEHYKQGIGRRLTEKVVETLADKGCKTQLLIATQMGEKLYEQLGFRTSCVYNFYEVKQIENNRLPDEIRLMNEEDNSRILEIDKIISGENREHMLKMYDTGAFVYEDPADRKIRGFFLPVLGEGMISALDSEAGLALLKFKHTVRKSKSTLPEPNTDANEFLVGNGFTKTLSAPRMVLGDEVDWKPECVFSRIGGHYA